MPARYRARLLAGFAGAMLPLAFAPFYLFPLAILSPAALFFLWRDADARQSAWLGFFYGLAAFGVGVSWVYVTLHVFGRMAPLLAALSTLLFVSGLGLFYALTGYLQARFRPDSPFIHFVLTLPAVWVLLEWLRGWVLTGFPWLQLGYSQPMTPLGLVAPWLGVYGTGYLVAITAGLCAWAANRRGRAAMVKALAVMTLVWVTPLLLSLVQWVAPDGKPVRVALVQLSVPLKEKWGADNRRTILQRYLEKSRQARGADIIIWPEVAIPAYLQYVDSAYLRELQNEARLYATDFLIGVLELGDKTNSTYFNSVIHINADGVSPQIYRKSHLVPFGEYPPLDPVFRWLMQSMQIPMSNFNAGKPGQAPMPAAGRLVALSICYENLFGAELLHALPQAGLLVNVSENAWYGRSFAAHQLVQMAQMRSLETGRPGVRVDNAGPSVVIDANGRVTWRSEQFTEVVLSSTVQPMRGATPYVRWGNSVILGWLMLVVFLAIRLDRHKLKRG